MSTKTTIKRIALVAVSALGFGTLSAIAPANAAVTVSSISVGTIPASRAGSLIVIPITVNYTSAGTESITVAAKVTSAPLTGGAANAASVLGVTAAGTNGGANATTAANVLFWSDSAGAFNGSKVLSATSAGDITDDTTYLGMYLAGTTTAGNIAAAAAGGVAATALQTATASTDTSKTFYLAVRPDLAGTYSILVSASTTSGNLSYVAGDVSTSLSFTTAGAPTTATITNIGGTTIPAAVTSGYGALYKVTFKDAAGNATALSGDEAFKIVPSSGYVIKASTPSAPASQVLSGGSTSSITLGASDFFNGVAFFNAGGAAASTTVTLTGTGDAALSPAVTTTATYTTQAAAAGAATNTFAGKGGTAVTSGWYTTGGNFIPSTSTSDTFELTYTGATTAKYGYLTVTDTQGRISGFNSATTLKYEKGYTQAAMTTAGADYVTVSIAHGLCTIDTTCYAVTDSGSASIGNVVAKTRGTGAGSTMTATQSSIRLATGGSVALQARLKDQFGVAYASQAVTITFSGRNSAKTTVNTVSDASGYVNYTFADTGTTGSSDVVTIASGATATTDISITYGTTTAGSVLVSTPSTNAYNASSLAGADKYPMTYSEIAAGDAGAGAEAAAVTAYALVKDANGVVMAGMPVAWTISGTGCAVTSTKATTYTNSAGVASATFYSWATGSCVVTATSGGKSDDANSYWSQTGTAEARSVAATVSGNSITAVVKDRFGNTIAGVPLKATRVSGTGGFGGSSSATGTTDENGVVVFDVTGGDASVKIGFNPSDGTSLTYGQTDALKGLVDGTTATNTFTAYTAGTTTVAEEGVGAAYDAAGVNSVTVEVTSTGNADAIDAANEATDAANAATDAANAAAEAADAATAAAQDAQAAVAELATKVASLIAGIKAQITTLTNLVIKIQKKVRA